MACGCEKQLEKVGVVTPDERDQIQRLYNRKNALKELALVLKEQSATTGEVEDILYEKIVTDLGETSYQFQDWWNQMGEKYQWEKNATAKWRINFNTCEVFFEVAATCEC